MANAEVNVNYPSSIHLSIPFSTVDSALMVRDILCVDKELQRGFVERQISVVGDLLIIEFKGYDLKRLRVSLNSIFKSILLILKTIDLFENK